MKDLHVSYTFTFDNEDEKRFRNIMSRLDPDEFVITEEICKIAPKYEHHYQTEKQTTMEMEPEAASMFRLGMKHLKIRRARTEEELAEEAALKAANTITITVKVDGLEV